MTDTSTIVGSSVAESPAQPAVDSATQAQARIVELQRDKSFSQRFSSGDAAARSEMQRLHETAYPGEMELSRDIREPGESEIDSAAAAAEIEGNAGRPDQFRIPDTHEAATAGLSPERQAEVKALDEASRAWLADAKLAPEHGTSLANSVYAVAKRFSDIKDPVARQRAMDAHDLQQGELLEKLWGADAPRMFKLGAALLDELEAKRPGVKEFLRASGAATDARVVSLIAGHAEKLAAARKR